jgi:hypothetical protein
LNAEPQAIAGDVSSHNYAAYSSGIAPASGFGASYPLLALAAPSLRPSGFPHAQKHPTTTRRPIYAQTTHFQGIEVEEELDGGYLQESSSSSPDYTEQEETEGIGIGEQLHNFYLKHLN